LSIGRLWLALKQMGLRLKKSHSTLVDTQNRDEIAKLDSGSSLPGTMRKLQFIHKGQHLTATLEGYGAVVLATNDAHIVETL
jgi:hypothetical protein